MAVSKVILDGVTQMDVTNDTVDVTNLLSGYTALKNDGTDITGTASGGPTILTDVLTTTTTSTSIRFTNITDFPSFFIVLLYPSSNVSINDLIVSTVYMNPNISPNPDSYWALLAKTNETTILNSSEITVSTWGGLTIAYSSSCFQPGTYVIYYIM